MAIEAKGLEQPRFDHARAGDEPVDPTSLAGDLLDGRFAIRRIHNVEPSGGDLLPGVLADRVAGVFQPGLIPGQKRHMIASQVQEPRAREPYAAGAAGNDRRFSTFPRGGGRSGHHAISSISSSRKYH